MLKIALDELNLKIYSGDIHYLMDLLFMSVCLSVRASVCPFVESFESYLVPNMLYSSKQMDRQTDRHTNIIFPYSSAILLDNNMQL